MDACHYHFERMNQTSIRDTTPFVTEMVSPPRGYPTTVTASCHQENKTENSSKNLKMKKVGITTLA